VREVQAGAAARTDGGDVDTARSLAGQQVPEDERAVLGHRDQLVGCRAKHDVADHLKQAARCGLTLPLMQQLVRLANNAEPPKSSEKMYEHVKIE